MNHTSTSIYDGLDLTESHDIPEAVADALGEFIREEILTQPILQEDHKKDRLVNCMAKMMERYFCRFYDVLAIYEKGKRPAYREWENSVNGALRNHFAEYQSLYQHVAFLQDKGYHMTAWSLAYIVDSALKSLSIDRETYQSLDNRSRDEIVYLVDFGGRCMAHMKDSGVVS